MLIGSIPNDNDLITMICNRAEENAFTPSEKESFSKFCDHYANDLVPFLNRCLHALFPQQQLAQTLGLSMADLNKLVHYHFVHADFSNPFIFY